MPYPQPEVVAFALVASKSGVHCVHKHVDRISAALSATLGGRVVCHGSDPPREASIDFAANPKDGYLDHNVHARDLRNSSGRLLACVNRLPAGGIQPQ